MKYNIPLTASQESFIKENYESMTVSDMAMELDFESGYKVHKFLTANGLKKGKKELTEEQKNFIRKNNSKYSESQLRKELGLKSRMLIQEFKREEGIRTRNFISKTDKPKETEGEFFVERRNWFL